VHWQDVSERTVKVYDKVDAEPPLVLLEQARER
jgi:hypothetical protein